MDKNELKKKSREMSYLLRHDPKDLKISKKGWIAIDHLLAHLGMNMSELKEIVTNNDKQRFSFDDEMMYIRANQGHSIKGIDVGLEIKNPNQVLYHGTSEKTKDIILKEGISPMNRTHVHLSKDIKTANIVAKRRKGNIVIFVVDAMRMRADGIKIYCSENGVWLVSRTIDPKYLTIL